MPKNKNNLVQKMAFTLELGSVFVLLVLIAITYFVATNLSPTTYSVPQTNPKVLGQQTGTLTIQAIPYASDPVIKNNSLTESPDGLTYTEEIQLKNLQLSRYKLPILHISNTSNQSQTIIINAKFSPRLPQTEISLVYKGVSFVIHDKDGNTFIPQITVPKQSVETVSLEIENEASFNFSPAFQLELTVTE